MKNILWSVCKKSLSRSKRRTGSKKESIYVNFSIWDFLMWLTIICPMLTCSNSSGTFVCYTKRRVSLERYRRGSHWLCGFDWKRSNELWNFACLDCKSNHPHFVLRALEYRHFAAPIPEVRLVKREAVRNLWDWGLTDWKTWLIDQLEQICIQFPRTLKLSQFRSQE